MEITKITVERFKKIYKLDLPLSPINFLVGGNNAGKSSVLQAIHTAITSARVAVEVDSTIVPDDRIVYCPTADFADIGHGGRLENRSGGRRALVTLAGKSDDGAEAFYKIELYRGKNGAGAGVVRTGTQVGFGSYIIKSNPPFSIYAPGLAGVPTREEFRNLAIIIQKIAGGEANSVLRNVLFLINKDTNKLRELKGNMCRVFPEFDMSVEFDPEKRQYIEVYATTKRRADPLPLDLVGTGVLQALQLFSYTTYFKPPLLLLDEPDSHLHPSNQHQLIETLKTIVATSQTKIILATHSRHMINNLPENAKIFWLDDGKLNRDSNIDTLKLLNDLGALDQADQYTKDVVVLTEDNKKTLFTKLLTQIGINIENIGIASYNGVSNWQIATQLARQLLKPEQKLIVHRDRDFLTDTEVTTWKAAVKKYNAIPYVTEGSDIEMCFLLPEHLAKLTSEHDAEAIRIFLNAVISENDEAWRTKFKNKRREHVKKLYPDGGGPATADLCPANEPLKLEQVLGKELLSAVRERSQDLLGCKIDPLHSSDIQDLASNLRGAINDALGL